MYVYSIRLGSRLVAYTSPSPYIAKENSKQIIIYRITKLTRCYI